MEPIRHSETLANKHYTPGNNPNTRINQSNHSKSVKSHCNYTCLNYDHACRVSQEFHDAALS